METFIASQICHFNLVCLTFKFQSPFIESNNLKCFYEFSQLHFAINTRFNFIYLRWFYLTLLLFRILHKFFNLKKWLALFSNSKYWTNSFIGHLKVFCWQSRLSRLHFECSTQIFFFITKESFLHIIKSVIVPQSMNIISILHILYPLL
jgi:hypothetical protein